MALVRPLIGSCAIAAVLMAGTSAGVYSREAAGKDLVPGGYITVQPDRIVIHRKPPARW